MAKALELSPETLTVVASVPKAARVARVEAAAGRRGKAVVAREPLQVRWPVEDVKAAKLAALEGDFPTVSEYLLACFRAYRKGGEGA